MNALDRLRRAHTPLTEKECRKMDEDAAYEAIYLAEQQAIADRQYQDYLNREGNHLKEHREMTTAIQTQYCQRCNTMTNHGDDFCRPCRDHLDAQWRASKVKPATPAHLPVVADTATGGHTATWRVDYRKESTNSKWKYGILDSGFHVVAQTVNEDAARQIVSEHNSHALLVEALRDLVADVDEYATGQEIVMRRWPSMVRARAALNTVAKEGTDK